MAYRLRFSASIAQTSQTRSIGLIPAISAAGFAVLLVAKDGNGVSALFARSSHLREQQSSCAAYLRRFSSDRSFAGRSAGWRRTISAGSGTRAGAHPAEGLPAQAAFDGLLVPVLFACAAAGVCSRFQTLRRVGIATGSSNRSAHRHQSAGKIPRGRCFFRNSRSASTSRIIALLLKIAACTPFMHQYPPQALLAAQALLLTVTDHSGSMQTAVPQNHQTPFRPAYRLPPSAPAAL